MIAWISFAVLAAWLLVVDGALARGWPGAAPSLFACLVVFVATSLRPGLVPWSALWLAATRAPLRGIDPWSELVLVALVVLVLLPLRRWLFRSWSVLLGVESALVAVAVGCAEEWWLQGAVRLPAVGAWLASAAWTMVLATMLFATVLRMPPFRSVSERGVL